VCVIIPQVTRARIFRAFAGICLVCLTGGARHWGKSSALSWGASEPDEQIEAITGRGNGTRSKRVAWPDKFSEDSRRDSAVLSGLGPWHGAEARIAGYADPYSVPGAGSALIRSGEASGQEAVQKAGSEALPPETLSPEEVSPAAGVVPEPPVEPDVPEPPVSQAGFAGLPPGLDSDERVAGEPPSDRAEKMPPAVGLESHPSSPAANQPSGLSSATAGPSARAPGGLREDLRDSEDSHSAPGEAEPHAEATTPAVDESPEKPAPSLPPRLREALSNQDVSEVVRRRLPSVQLCYRRLKRAGRPPSGRAVVTFFVTPGGSASDLALQAPAFVRTSLPDCVLKTIKRWAFPPSEKGSALVQYPFVFVAD